jgi:cell surface protein SprA
LKNRAKISLKYKGFKQLVVFIILFGFTQITVAQDTNEQEADSVKTGYTLGRLRMNNPNSIVSKYTYNPTLDSYIYTETVGEFDISYPVILTTEQYQELVSKESMKSYFKDKMDAYTGKKEGSEEARKNLLPNFYVNNSFFESIFGGNTIEVIPQGSVAMDLGIIWQKNDNPSLSERNRTNLSFDFDQRISLSLLGKIGEKLEVNANYDTEATFDFQNIVKLEYTPNEDDILQKIEVGNVSMPLNSSLIQGSQSLFGVKAELQFGKTTVTAVYSNQQSQTTTVVAEGSSTVNEFSLSALDYEDDKHFFLSQYFRDHYDEALEQYPYINSGVQITSIEVWVTNSIQETDNVRNVVAIQDLGESEVENTRIGQMNSNPAGFFNTSSAGELPRNGANDYSPDLIGSGGVLTSSIRDVSTVEAGFNVSGYQVNQGYDYSILENARKLTSGTDYEYDDQLGYISLNSQLSSDEILAVAYQYTYKGQIYQVGEFANTVTATASTGTSNALVLKLLKSSITTVSDPIWDLMMKNIYATGAYSMSEEDFTFNILYSDPTSRNYITKVSDTGWPTGLEERVLLEVFNFDRLNSYGDLQSGGDGFFDYYEGITINATRGRIIFTKVEPFGEYLFDLLGGGTYELDNDQGYNENQTKYVFRNMYASTQADALEDTEKDKFVLSGRYKSDSSSGISIGAFNVTQGSVTVTANSRVLTEGIDYTVNYTAGTVQILDATLLASDTPITISVEDSATFGQQTQTFAGVNVEHQVSKDFLIGATLLNFSQKPQTQKTNYGSESVNNTMFGLNANYSTELPFLTRLVNKLPNIDTDVPSNLSVRGEIAFLMPGTPSSDDFDGEVTTYIDDFEGSESSIDIKSSLGWYLASTPLEFTDNETLSGSSTTDPANLENGYERAKMAWYSIDATFYTSQRPSDISDSDVSTNKTRRIYVDEVFPETELSTGESTVQTTLDLAYYPNEKGPYNNNPSFETIQADDKWGGIMRPLTTTDFETSNVEYIEFWVLDPYVDGDATSSGELVINIGNISEDILKDGKKQYENGLPSADSSELVTTTSWGQVPTSTALVYAFDVDEDNRVLQDVGYDGFSDADEASIFTNNTGSDPALDNYVYYLNREGSIPERYYDYNNLEGNSPVSVTDTDSGSTTLPDVEDIDRDLTMNTINSYYEYRIPISSTTTVDDDYVADIITNELSGSTIPDGSVVSSRWIQYKIPLTDFTDDIGGISDFRSMSFMRLYLTGFTDDVTLRFATLDLIRGDWRTYSSSLQPDVDDYPDDDGTTVEISTVSIEENSSKTPIPYVLPPGVEREQLNTNNTIVDQNEQSLSFIVENLESEDSRAVYKNVDLDLRQYEELKMFIHAEEILDSDYVDGETPLVGFVRIGTDFSENFYHIEIPLQFSSYDSTTDEEVWPDLNELTISLSDLSLVKSYGILNESLTDVNYYEIIDDEAVLVDEFDDRTAGVPRIGIKGNPSLGSIESLMIGVKNSDNEDASGEIWFDELRLAGIDESGGWAAIAAVDLNIADFATLSASGSHSTTGFGSIDQTTIERSLEDVSSYDVVANVNLGQLLPNKWGIQLPFSYGISEELVTPEYDPVYEDLKLEDRIAAAATQEEKDEILEQAQEYTKRTSVNFTGVRKNRSEEAEANFYDIENFTFNYSYNETNYHDFEYEEVKEQDVYTGFVYNHAFKPVSVAPFAKKDSLFTGDYWKWLKELNLNLLPTSVSINSNINRSFNQQQYRDVLEAGVESLDLPLLQQRNYLFTWQYSLNYSLSKSLTVNLQGSNNNIVRNYYEEDGNTASEINEELGIWDGFWDLGEPNTYAQQMQLNYDLPFKMVPALEFITGQYTYTSNFDWQRGGDALTEVAGESINTVQNANTHTLSANMNMQKLYDLVGLKKVKGNSRAKSAKKSVSKVASGKKGKEESENKTSPLFNTFVDFVTMVKRVNFTYNQSGGIVLPGYTQSVGFIGTTKPSSAYVFGGQNSDIRYEAAKRGWLTTFTDFSDQFVKSINRQLNITATVQPINDLTIDLSADRQYSNSYEESFLVNSLGDNVFEYEELIGNDYGNFSISTVMLGTAFKKSDEARSETFETFKENRLIIANRILSDRNQTAGELDEDGFPEQYSKTNQSVLLPAFFAAYTGQDVNRVNLDEMREIPIPNWSLKYTGLMNNKWFKKKFKRFSLSHGYRASYSINSFQTNLTKVALLNEGLDPVDSETLDILPDNTISNIVLTDQFNPLVKVDFEMKNSLSVLAEISTNRTLSLSFDNSLLTEINGKDYTLGLGYRFKDVQLVTNIGGQKTRLKGDLNIKIDGTLRNNVTYIRSLDVENNEITSGQDLFSLKYSMDYALSKNLSATFFYDHSYSKYAVSTAYPQTTINSGFTVIYNFGN